MSFIYIYILFLQIALGKRCIWCAEKRYIPLCLANNAYFGATLINYEMGNVIALLAVLVQDVGLRTFIAIHHCLH